ncbi:MAG: prohead protease/major capsid protein fusion protein [Burkholderiales bacterium]
MPEGLTTRRETRELPLQLRFAPVSNVDAKARTIDVVWTTGARVRRYDWRFDREYLEELSLEPGAINMERLNSGKAPFLDAHARWELRSVLGVVEGTRIENGEHLARVRFSKRAEVQPIFEDVQDKILQNVSVGYSVQRMEMIPPAKEGEDWVYRAALWTPHELSLVPIGADNGAGTRSEQDERAGGRPFFPAEFISREEIHMPQPNTDPGAAAPASTEPVRAERGRVADIHRRVRSANLPQEFADDLVERGVTLDAACRAIVDEIAERRALPPIIPYMTTEDRSGGRETMRRDMADGFLARLGDPCPNERAARYARFTLKDMASTCLEAIGVRVRDMSSDEIFRRAMSSSDLPNILGDATYRRLRAGFDAFPAGVKMISQEKRVRDFRVQNEVQLSEAASLERVLDGAEYKHSRLSDSKETFQLETFGRIISVTRHTLVNDDLSAFDRIPRLFGAACRQKENAAICAILTANGTMSDGGALFNATAVSSGGPGHANLGTGTGSALAIGSLSAGIKALRLQKGLDAATPIAVVPKFLIVPAALEASARALVATLNPAAVADVNPWQGLLEVLVDPLLDGSSTTAWYLAADPTLLDGGVIHAYRDDAPGPQLTSEQNFHTDEWGWKVTFDFTAAVTEFRGLYKANGA